MSSKLQSGVTFELKKLFKWFFVQNKAEISYLRKNNIVVPKTQQKQQKQHFPKNVDFSSNFSTFSVKIETCRVKRGTFWKEFQHHCIRGRCYSAEKSIFWLIHVRKKCFLGQKIQKNRFQSRSKSHLNVYSASKTCLGTPKGRTIWRL